MNSNDADNRIREGDPPIIPNSVRASRGDSPLPSHGLWSLVWLLPAVAHTLLGCLICLAVWSSDDGEAGMAWFLFDEIDWPISKLFYHDHNNSFEFVSGVLLLGGLQWAVIGAITCRLLGYLKVGEKKS